MELDPSIGAYFIGVVVSSVLFGAMSVQMFYYSQTYSDHATLRATVAIIWFLDCLHSILVAHSAYLLLIQDFANPLALNQLVWSGCTAVGLTGIITVIVHLFFARRVWYMRGKSILLVSFIVVLSVGHLGAVWAVAGDSLKLQWYPSINHGWVQRIGRASLSIALAVDALIAASLCYSLHTKRSGFRRSNDLVNKLIIYIINNGLLTIAADLLALAFSVTKLTSMIYLAVYQVVAKLYSNSLLATLNYRGTASKILDGNSHAIKLSALEAASPDLRTEPPPLPFGSDTSRDIEERPSGSELHVARGADHL